MCFSVVDQFCSRKRCKCACSAERCDECMQSVSRKIFSQDTHSDVEQKVGKVWKLWQLNAFTIFKRDLTHNHPLFWFVDDMHSSTHFSSRINRSLSQFYLAFALCITGAARFSFFSFLYLVNRPVSLIPYLQLTNLHVQGSNPACSSSVAMPIFNFSRFVSF